MTQSPKSTYLVDLVMKQIQGQTEKDMKFLKELLEK